jgi:hypothetical protein
MNETEEADAKIFQEKSGRCFSGYKSYQFSFQNKGRK